MHLFLTSVLPFLAHDHASAVAFLTCRHHNFHASIIPEFLSDEERVKSFCEARQQYHFEADLTEQYSNLYGLFAQTPLMQFSPSLLFHHGYSAKSILKKLLATKYFTRTLQRCDVLIRISSDLLQGLSKVQSLTNLVLGWLENRHLEIIINSFPSLETLTIYYAGDLKIINEKTAISISSPPPPATKTLRSLRLDEVDPLFATQFVSNFPNLTKLNLVLSPQNSAQELDLLPLSSSLPFLTDLSIRNFTLKNIESLNTLVDLSSLEFKFCRKPDLSFLTQEENSLPHLTTLSIDGFVELPTSSFASLVHAPNLHVLKLTSSGNFDNDCLRYLEKMVHLRKLDLRSSRIVSDSQSLKTLIQNLFQLEELVLSGCRDIGGQGGIAGALYSIHSRMRVLNLRCCDLVDDDLNGIGALKNTLEVLYLSRNEKLTNEALVHCKDLVKLKRMNLSGCTGIDDLSPLKDCLNLEELFVSDCQGLTDDSFKVFSEEPNSFPKLRVLELSEMEQLRGKVFEHLANNNNLVYRLKELHLSREGRRALSSSPIARHNLCKLKGLRRLRGIVDDSSLGPSNEEVELVAKLLQRLMNLEKVE